MVTVTRDSHNPLVKPDPATPWQAEATFNPSPVTYHGDNYLVFRAASHPALYENETVELSTIAIAQELPDGHYGAPRQLVVPSESWDKYGCEDPRVTKLGDTYYIFYTALGGYPFGAENIKAAVAITKDLEHIEAKHLITPFNAKAMALFPERVDGKLQVILTANSDLPPSRIGIAQFNDISDMWSTAFWEDWYEHLEEHTLELLRGNGDHVEVGAPPIWTTDGWLLVYSHIKNYFSESKIFGIEAALLDHANPCKILRRTIYPLMVPEEGYERFGRLPRIIFPSGAVRHGDKFTIYYGSTDTSCCRATVSFAGLLDALSADNAVKQHVKRAPENPILEPIAAHPWEASHVLNPAAVEINNDVYIMYRAVGPDNTSVSGLARSHDGVKIVERLADPIYVPRVKFELKAGGPTDNSGCEDARIVRIGDHLYITYTAYDSVSNPKVAESSISVDDFLHHRFDKWTMPEIITPQGVDDKDACLFSEKINGQYMILHRVSSHICGDFVDSLNFRREKVTRCIQIIGPRPGMWDDKKVGIAGPPIKTAHGWILFYHGITEAHEYCLGAVLLDPKDPTRVIGRSSQPIMTPVLDWEREGWISNVVFPCGQVVRDGVIYLYYGGADHVVGVATIEVRELIKQLTPLT